MQKDWIWEQSSWPNFHWDAADLEKDLASARLAQGKIAGRVQLLDPRSSLEVIADILVDDGIKTSAIEGEKLDLEGVRSSVARHLGLPLPLANNIETSDLIEGLVTVLLDATQQYQQPLTLERLCHWNYELLGGDTVRSQNLWLTPIKKGVLRGNEKPMQVVSGPYGRERVHFQAPPGEVLLSELEKFLDWFNLSSSSSPSPSSDGLIRAGLAHLWFVTLHPFEDGNGRLARAITDMAVAQDENQPMRLFSISSQIAKERKSYYDILEKTQRGDVVITEWLKWFLNQVEKACKNSEATIEKVFLKTRFWLKFKDVDLNIRQRKVLNRLLDTGPSNFEGGMTTRKYSNLTKTSRTTAYRELSDLVSKGCLAPTPSKGRSSGYDIQI